MSYRICEVRVLCDFEEAVTNLFMECGACGVSAEGAPLIRESIEAGNAEIWDESQVSSSDKDLVVKAFFEDDEDFAGKKDNVVASIAVFELLNGIPLSPSFYALADESWQDNWKQYYKPFRVGKHLVIKPTWEEYSPLENDVVLELDPGLAFGTGSHPTTNGALRLIETCLKSGDRVIDCGCGSGILAVAAGKLGADKVFAVDIDHEAVLSAVKNIRINGLFDKIEVFCADVTEKSFDRLAPFDMIVANIVADVIIPMLPRAASIGKKGSVLIAGGIISHRRDDVFAALEKNGFEVKMVLEDGEWVTLAAERI